ncbi:MAG: sugar phosphate isomerase/epimerase [Sphingomonadaceae bacterium]
MRELALHQITAMEASPPDLVSIAAEAGCKKVCIFVLSPLVPVNGSDRMEPLFPTVTDDTKQAMKDRLAACGVSVMNIEFFPIDADTDLQSYRAPLALGAELGAERIVTHVHDTDTERAARNLALLCDIAQEYGLQVGLEFMGLSPGCNSLAKARELVLKAKRPNLGIAIDALHLVRTGSRIDEVAALDPELIAYVQLCDGPHLEKSDDYLPEALDRLAPGEGVFPLKEFVRALPANVPMDVEVPSEKLRAEGIGPLERTIRAVHACRALLQDAAA